ncbi:unnamed protein product, partial [Meganyctiphanes norvegica]
VVTLFTSSREDLLNKMKTLIILGVFGLCLGSPFNPEYPDYGGEGSQLYQPQAEERSQQAFQPPQLLTEESQRYHSVADDRSQAYQPPQLQVLDDDSRYETRYDPKHEEDYYYDDEEDSLNSIPGEPGKDYPVLGVIPRTSFGCADRLPGFYADMETQCQVWHYCKTDGLLDSFLCPNGTIYNQENRVCEWWFNVNCEDNEQHARVNEDLYIVPEKKQDYQAAEQRMYKQQQQRQQQQQQEQLEEFRPPVYQQDPYQQ